VCFCVCVCVCVSCGVCVCGVCLCVVCVCVCGVCVRACVGGSARARARRIHVCKQQEELSLNIIFSSDLFL
jgi:hypothetical protein